MSVYKSAFGGFTLYIMIAIIAFLTTMLGTSVFVAGEDIPWPVYLIVLVPILLLVWMSVGMRFIIDGDVLKYRAAFFRGTIPIESIRKIEYDNAFIKSALLKLGMDHRGLLIRYNKFDDIFISPERRSDFVAELHRLNPDIEVIGRP